MATPPGALAFDLDGVLIDSEPIHRRTWLECLEELGVRLAPDEHDQFQGRTAEQVVAWLRSRPGGDSIAFDRDAIVRRKRESFHDRIADELRPVAGADAFLRARKGETPLALVTSSGLKTVGRVMLHMNWRNVFDALVGAEHVGNFKPHPEPYLHAAERLKLPPARMLVFEDSEVGVRAARAAGAPVVGVATTLPPDRLRALGARWVVEDFRDEETLARALAGVGPRRFFGLFG